MKVKFTYFSIIIGDLIASYSVAMPRSQLKELLAIPQSMNSQAAMIS